MTLATIPPMLLAGLVCVVVCAGEATADLGAPSSVKLFNSIVTKSLWASVLTWVRPLCAGELLLAREWTLGLLSGEAGAMLPPLFASAASQRFNMESSDGRLELFEGTAATAGERGGNKDCGDECATDMRLNGCIPRGRWGLPSGLPSPGTAGRHRSKSSGWSPSSPDVSG
jgi:hypothetical protein